MSTQYLTNKYILLECIITEKIKSYEQIKQEITGRKCPQIYKFIISQSLLALKLVYRINEFTSAKSFMSLLNHEIIKTNGQKFANYDKNHQGIIKAKVEYDFNLRNDDITDEFTIDYDILHEEIN